VRGLIITTALCATSIVAGQIGAQSSPAGDVPASAVLREAARTGTLAGLKWPRFPFYRDELTGLYTASGWQPVWTANGRPISAARSAIDVLRSADERGLHPDDYSAAKLDEEFRKLSSGTGSPQDVGWFDVALSIGVLRHISDVRIGRVNPRNLSVGINIEPKKLDLARELSAAIPRNRVPDLVRSAEPQFVQYKNLKAAYARYRKLAADTTLSAVSLARTVKINEAIDPAAAAKLRRRLVAFGDLPGAAAGAAAAGTYDRVTADAVSRF